MKNVCMIEIRHNKVTENHVNDNDNGNLTLTTLRVEVTWVGTRNMGDVDFGTIFFAMYWVGLSILLVVVNLRQSSSTHHFFPLN